MATIPAANASQGAVEAAVGAAFDGDTVTIPDGSATWPAGISTTKQIIIRALNYTPVPKPDASTVRKVVITYTGTTGFAIEMASGNNYHCGVGGIKFLPPTTGRQEGATGIYGYVHFTGSGNKPPLLFDCHIVGNERTNVTAGQAAFVAFDSIGGVMWNTFLDGTLVDNNLAGGGGDGMSGAGVHIGSSRGYLTASTMGTLDTGGLTNIYVEDSRFDWWGQMDCDNNARVVVRKSLWIGCSWQTHGFTSTNGGRHVELYDNDLVNNRANRNHTRWFWLRAGSVVITRNNISAQTTGFGGASLYLCVTGDNNTPASFGFGAYPANRAVTGPANPGWGHNGSAFVIDPIYIWGNTIDPNFLPPNVSVSRVWANVDPSWDSFIQADRDVFVIGDGSGATSKPGYSSYTYPHPFRAMVVPPGPGPGPGPRPGPNPPGTKGPSATYYSGTNPEQSASTYYSGVEASTIAGPTN